MNRSTQLVLLYALLNLTFSLYHPLLTIHHIQLDIYALFYNLQSLLFALCISELQLSCCSVHPMKFGNIIILSSFKQEKKKKKKKHFTVILVGPTRQHENACSSLPIFNKG